MSNSQNNVNSTELVQRYNTVLLKIAETVELLKSLKDESDVVKNQIKCLSNIKLDEDSDTDNEPIIKSCTKKSTKVEAAAKSETVAKSKKISLKNNDDIDVDDDDNDDDDNQVAKKVVKKKVTKKIEVENLESTAKEPITKKKSKPAPMMMLMMMMLMMMMMMMMLMMMMIMMMIMMMMMMMMMTTG